MAEEIGISVKDKFCLTIEEASRYFGIGEKKLRKLVNSNLDAGFVIQNGVKILIKRQRFEQFLDKLSSIYAPHLAKSFKKAVGLIWKMSLGYGII